MDSSLIDPGTPPGAVATSFAQQELINASVMAKELRFPQEPLRTLRLCAFAPLRLCEKLVHAVRFLVKAQSSRRIFSRLRSFCPVAETMI
jgi:hypothetical protein